MAIGVLVLTARSDRGAGKASGCRLCAAKESLGGRVRVCVPRRQIWWKRRTLESMATGAERRGIGCGIESDRGSEVSNNTERRNHNSNPPRRRQVLLGTRSVPAPHGKELCAPDSFLVHYRSFYREHPCFHLISSSPTTVEYNSASSLKRRHNRMVITW